MHSRLVLIVRYPSASGVPRYFSITLFIRLNLLGTATWQACITFGGVNMNRELALKVVLTLVGLLFVATAYPLVLFMKEEPALSMMMSLYVTLGVFLLLAVRNPWAHRSLIAFTAWSSFAHAALMGTQALLKMIAHIELIGVAVLIVIGIALMVLAPASQPADHATARP